MGATYIMIEKEHSLGYSGRESDDGPYYTIEGEAYKPIVY